MGDGNRTDWGKIFGFAATAVAGTALAVGTYAAYNASQQSSQSNETRYRLVPPSPRPSHMHSDLNRRSVGDICEKHEAADPYYFFLSSATDSGKTSSNPLSLQFSDILDPSLGKLKCSLQINFVVDYDWLMSQYHLAKQGDTPITLIYEQMDLSNVDSKVVTAVKVKPKSPPGFHHTKMCVLEYEDGSVRVCVHTGNLNKFDWDSNVQGIWLSPRCPVLRRNSTEEGESPTYFKRDLIQYLSSYSQRPLEPWIKKLCGINFSYINVFFVASTPGSHKGMNSDKWGHAKLGSLLKQHAQIQRREYYPTSWQIIAQCSSIGSLGPEPDSWLCGEVKRAMSKGMRMETSIRVVYPSYENVENSLDDVNGGISLSYKENTHKKQVWLQEYLYGWKSDTRNRTKIMPHIKTYTCVSPDHSELAWFHLTSANLSKAAWGSESANGAFNISSYEAGVLFLPKFVISSSSFPIQKGVAGHSPVFPMPYDLPLTKYTSGDKPFFRWSYLEGLCGSSLYFIYCSIAIFMFSVTLYIVYFTNY